MILWITLLCICLVIIFIYGSLSELSQDAFERIAANTNKAKLQKIWNRYDEVSSSLLFIGLFIALFSLLKLNIIFFKQWDNYLLLDNFIVPLLASLIIIIINFIALFLGKRFSEQTFVKFAPAIYFVTRPFVPIIRTLNLLLIRISGRDNDDVSVEEITDLVNEAHEDGSIDAGEFRLLTNVIKFGNIYTGDIMTPRIVLFSCKADMTIEEVAKLPELQIYSRFPIWNGENIDDEVVGYVTTKEVFNAALNGSNAKVLQDLVRPINFIPENVELRVALEELLRNKQHLYLVVDEYGGIEGLVTLEDVIETILGVEIIDEADKVEDLRQLAKQKREARIKTINVTDEQ